MSLLSEHTFSVLTVLHSPSASQKSPTLGRASPKLQSTTVPDGTESHSRGSMGSMK